MRRLQRRGGQHTESLIQKGEIQGRLDPQPYELLQKLTVLLRCEIHTHHRFTELNNTKDPCLALILQSTIMSKWLGNVAEQFYLRDVGLIISITPKPATDVGYLPPKNPGRCQIDEKMEYYVCKRIDCNQFT